MSGGIVWRALVHSFSYRETARWKRGMVISRLLSHARSATFRDHVAYLCVGGIDRADWITCVPSLHPRPRSRAAGCRITKFAPEPIRASSVCTERTISHRADSCGRILVMDAGRIVESAATSRISYEPKHPYRSGAAKVDSTKKEGPRTRFRVLRLISPSRFQAVHSRHAANLHSKNVTSTIDLKEI